MVCELLDACSRSDQSPPGEPIVRIRWLVGGVVFVPVSFGIVLLVLHLTGTPTGSPARDLENLIFYTGTFHVFSSFLIAEPRWNTRHVPRGSRAYRDPFAGLGRRNMYGADLHDYGVDEETAGRHLAQGLSFSMAGFVLLLISFAVPYLAAG